MNKLIVDIFDKQYTLLSEKNKDEILQITNIVNDEISNVKENSPNLTKVDLLIITCNNIAEKYFEEITKKSKEKELNSQIKEKDKEILSLKHQLEEKELEISSILKTDENKNSLQEKLENTKHDYEDKLKEQIEINQELESRFYELQMKIAKLEDELNK